MRMNSQHNTFFWLRNFLILGQVLLWVMAKTVWGIDYPLSVLVLSTFYFLMNLFYWYLKKQASDHPLFINLIIDLTELSLFFYLTGGASNPFTWFLIVPIIFSATTLPGKYTWLLTAYAITSYTLLIKFFKPVEMNMQDHMHHSTSFSQHLIGMWLGFIVLSILISWVIIGLIQNIHRKEDLLIKAKAKQSENEKILALATLATGSAHELGTPLATINILVKEMLNDAGIKSHHDMLKIMESQILRCKKSLTQITASTGTTQAINGMIVSVDKFLKSIQSRLIDPDSSRLNFNTDHKKNDKLHIDKTLVQAMVNIINNALESQASIVSVTTKVKNEKLGLFICDNGEGSIPNFQKRNHSDKEFGMGLGLFLAKTTIERFSGLIEIDTSNDKGTHLIILLPLKLDE